MDCHLAVRVLCPRLAMEAAAAHLLVKGAQGLVSAVRAAARYRRHTEQEKATGNEELPVAARPATMPYNFGDGSTERCPRYLV